MSGKNGVIRIGRKGIKKFAFGEDGLPFEVDVVTSFQEWICIDESFRDEDRRIKPENMASYHNAAVDFAQRLSNSPVTTAEALDFIARLNEQYNEIANFFQPRLPEKRDSPDITASEIRFSAEESLTPSTN